MKNQYKIYFLCISITIIFSCCAEGQDSKVKSPVKENANKIVIGTIDTLYSKILGESRTFWVHVPDSIPGPFFTNKLGYPVLYVLDAEVNFQSVVGTLHNLSRDNWNCRTPQMIVVGITNTNRFRDFSPTHVDSALGMDKQFASVTGGGENFTSFLEQELMPYIESKYKTQPYRLLIGHSLGGLFAVNTMINHAKLFNSYIAIDPSLHWDNQQLLNLSKEQLQQKKWLGKSIYLAIARNWEASLDTSDIRQTESKEYMNQRCLLFFTDILRKNQGNGLNWNYKYYSDEDHVTVPHIAIYDGLRFIFKNFELPTYTDLHAKQFNSDSFITRRYEALYAESGYRFAPPEIPLYLKIINLLNEKESDKALPLIKIMLKHYPNSHASWSMGEYYKLKGDTARAIEYFTKALAYEDDPGVRQELNELKNK